MGNSSALDIVKVAWNATTSTLYPEKPQALYESGDIEEDGVASKKETGYGELQRVWRELSPAQIPHLFVTTLLVIHILETAAKGSVISCSLHSLGAFVVYRDLATGGLYILAIRALKGQIVQVDRLALEITNLKTATDLVQAAGGDVDKAVKDLIEQVNRNEAAAARNEAAAARNEASAASNEASAARNKAAAASNEASAAKNKAATAKLEEAERKINTVTNHLERVGTPQKQRRRSRSFSGIPTTPS